MGRGREYDDDGIGVDGVVTPLEAFAVPLEWAGGIVVVVAVPLGP